MVFMWCRIVENDSMRKEAFWVGSTRGGCVNEAGRGLPGGVPPPQKACFEGINRHSYLDRFKVTAY